MSKRIEICIAKDGDMKISTKGFSGMTCLDHIRELTRLSGLDLKAQEMIANPESETSETKVKVE
mgnify:CR=1 FL=1